MYRFQSFSAKNTERNWIITQHIIYYFRCTPTPSLSLSPSTPRNTQNISISPLHKILRRAEEERKGFEPWSLSMPVESSSPSDNATYAISSPLRVLLAPKFTAAQWCLFTNASLQHASRANILAAGKLQRFLANILLLPSPISRSLALPPRIRSKYFIPNDAKTVAIYV